MIDHERLNLVPHFGARSNRPVRREVADAVLESGGQIELGTGGGLGAEFGDILLTALKRKLGTAVI